MRDIIYVNYLARKSLDMSKQRNCEESKDGVLTLFKLFRGLKLLYYSIFQSPIIIEKTLAKKEQKRRKRDEPTILISIILI